MNTETTTIDRQAEAHRYARYGRTADRVRSLSRGQVRKYRGRYPHQWFALANATRAHFTAA